MDVKMENEIFKIQAKSYEQVWEKDKELLKSIIIFGANRLPTSQNARSILITRQNRWKGPTKRLVLNQDSLDGVLARCLTDIKDSWGIELAELPFIELCDTQDYLPRIACLDKETNKQFGYGGVCKSPPTMYSSPFLKVLVMPKKFIVRKPTGAYTTDVESPDFESLEFKWDNAFFEEVLFEELSHALFRQIRGEWGDNYVKIMKELGHEKESKISLLNEVTAQVAKESIADRKGWNLYVVGEKIRLVWQDRAGMECYRAIDALSSFGKLADICKADEFFTFPEEVGASFYPDHFKFQEKYSEFVASVRGRKKK